MVSLVTSHWPSTEPFLIIMFLGLAYSCLQMAMSFFSDVFFMGDLIMCLHLCLFLGLGAGTSSTYSFSLKNKDGSINFTYPSL